LKRRTSRHTFLDISAIAHAGRTSAITCITPTPPV
jgi:hypothetical protein